PVLRAPSPRLSRAAQLAFYVTLAGASTMHCSAGVTDPESPVPLLSPDASPEPGAADASTADATMTPQGIAPQDAGSDAAAHPTMIAIYGDPTVRIMQHIHFSLGKTTAGEQETDTLRAIVEVMREHPFVIQIDGHADPTEKLPGISLRRAQHVH